MSQRAERQTFTLRIEQAREPGQGCGLQRRSVEMAQRAGARVRSWSRRKELEWIISYSIGPLRPGRPKKGAPTSSCLSPSSPAHEQRSTTNTPLYTSSYSHSHEVRQCVPQQSRLGVEIRTSKAYARHRQNAVNSMLCYMNRCANWRDEETACWSKVSLRTKCTYLAKYPPSTGIGTPVMKLASSEAKKTAASAVVC